MGRAELFPDVLGQNLLQLLVATGIAWPVAASLHLGLCGHIASYSLKTLSACLL